MGTEGQARKGADGVTLKRDAALRAAALIARIEVVPDEAALQALMVRLLARDGVTTVAFVNAQSFNLVWESAEAFRAFMDADVLLRDGIGIKLHFRLSGREPGLNLSGTDFIPKLLAASVGRELALFGTAEPWLGRAAAAFEAAGQNIVARENGFEPIEVYTDTLARNPARVVLLAMGMPRQERVAAHIRRQSPQKPAQLLICGGAILDFVAGRHPRAPRWMRAIGMEWLFRLMREPRRLFRRYVIGNARFLWRSRAARRL